MSAHVGCEFAGSEMCRDAAIAAVLTLIVAMPATGQTPTFARHDYASFAGARAVVSADFNRDGTPDLGQANTGRNSVTILLNMAGTGLVRSADVTVGAGPFDLTTADFNGDGIPDLAVANADGNSVSVLLGRGDGTFTRSDIAAPSQNPRGIASGDVNADGRPDLIYSAYATGQVQVLTGTGSGTFTRGVTYASSTPRAQGIAPADFNRDGKLDLAIAYASGAGLRMLYGDGGTSFTARAVPGASNLNVVAAGDFDRDGWTDVAAASTAAGSVAIYRGGASGLVHQQDCVVGSSPRGIAAGDVNSDGLLDVVTASRTASTVSVVLGDSAHPGTFLDHVEVPAGSGSRAVVLADFDADARLDVASVNEFAASVTMLSNRLDLGPAGYAFRHVPTSGGGLTDSFANAVVLADFNRDGRLDLAHDTGTPAIEVLLTGGATFTLPAAGYLRTLKTADLNGDGSVDLLFDMYFPDSVGTYLGDGAGGFTRGPATAWRSASLAVGDMNRDGRPDLVSVVNEPGPQWFLQIGLGRGDGTFVTPTTRTMLPDAASEIAVADVNRDGYLDVAAVVSGYSRLQPAELRVWLGTGDGGLTATSRTIRFISFGGPRFSLDDVNRDGFLDVIASEEHRMGVALGTAAGFATLTYSPVATDDQFGGSLAVADLNDDGSLDVAFESGHVMFGDGDGRFTDAGRFDYFDYNSLVAVRIADVTHDGLADLVAFNATGVVVLANTRDRANRPPVVNVGPDRTIAYGDTQGEDCEAFVIANALDPDAHALTYEWRTGNELVSTYPTLYLCGPRPATYVYTLTVRDGRGGAATDSLTVTIPSIPEIVLWAANVEPQGRWTLVADPTAAGGARAFDPNLGAPKVTVPMEDTPNVLSFRFYADPGLTYKLWIRLKGERNSWTNDSVWVQFFGAGEEDGTPKYSIGTNSGLAVSLEECSGCGISGWGWEDDGWGAPNTNGVMLRFPKSPDRDPVTMQIQTREDGVSIDQIVLSSQKYVTTRPGAAKDDTTILPSIHPSRGGH
jgi:hypothetical protein